VHVVNLPEPDTLDAQPDEGNIQNCNPHSNQAAIGEDPLSGGLNSWWQIGLHSAEQQSKMALHALKPALHPKQVPSELTHRQLDR
jgi:hypothetical protein